jgi:large subunit ribosomal protein L10
MSKQIKQMEMEALRVAFRDVRDMVLLSASGVNAQVNNQLRNNLRKKNIRLQVVKNSLARRVFDELGIKLVDAWQEPTLVAWGAGSVSELSRELEGVIKKNDRFRVKTAVAEGQELTFAQALKMPTRSEAIAHVVGLALSPAARLVSQMLAPAGRVAGQIKTLRERTAATEEKLATNSAAAN